MDKKTEINSLESAYKVEWIRFKQQYSWLSSIFFLKKFLRQEIGKRYNALFSDANIDHILQHNDRSSVFAQYTIFSDNREKLAQELNLKGIPTAVHYKNPVYFHEPYKNFETECSVANLASRQVLSLPMHPYLSESDQIFIVDAITNFVSNNL